MLTEQRYEYILNMLDEKKSITVGEVKTRLNTSESTVRRDITALHNAGRLVKVFGGAVAVDKNSTFTNQELTVAQKVEVNKEEKMRIAKYAAAMVDSDDFIYLDAGTTTGYMLEYASSWKATVVTNAVAHAQRLAAMGVHVYLVGGELKSSTEAIVGSLAIEMLQNYHFTKGFFGTNGITLENGFTTPDANEAQMKKTAMRQCKSCYVLCDNSKFDQVSSMTFAPFGKAEILTDCRPAGYEECDHIILASQLA